MENFSATYIKIWIAYVYTLTIVLGALKEVGELFQMKEALFKDSLVYILLGCLYNFVGSHYNGS